MTRLPNVVPVVSDTGILNSALFGARLKPYASAILMSFACVGIRFVLGDYFSPQIYPFLLFYPAIIINTYQYGKLSGLLTVFIATLTTDYLFIVPTHHILPPSVNETIGLFLFIFIGCVVVWFIDIAYKQRIELTKYNISRERLATIVQHANEPIISKDIRGVITAWNPAATRIFGYTEREAIGQSISMLYPPDKKHELQRVITHVANGKKIERYETLRVAKSGKRVFVTISVAPMHDTKGNITGAADIMVDTTEKKLYQEKKDEYFGVVSHELKTPVTTIKAFTQLMLREVKDKKLHHYLDRNARQIDRLEELIKDLLDTTRIQSGKMQLRKTAFYIDELVRDAVEDAQSLTTHHKIYAELKAFEQVYADKDRLGQVLTNLLTNAIKYSPSAQRIDVKTWRDEKCAYISVKDFGVGVAKNEQSQILKRFYRATDHSKGTISGLGLGLFISNEIVKKHRGKLMVYSKENEGSIFTVQLPISRRFRQ